MKCNELVHRGNDERKTKQAAAADQARPPPEPFNEKTLRTSVRAQCGNSIGRECQNS